MLTTTGLIQQITNTIGKAKVLELSQILKKQNFALRDLIDLTFYPDKDIAFRAAWILENLFLKEQPIYEQELAYLLSRVPEIKHPGCQRHYAKILMHLTSKKAPIAIAKKLAKIDLEPVVEKCFDWIIDPKVKVAVKVFSAEILYNLTERFTWIKDELANQIMFLMKNGSAAIQSKGKKILKALEM